MAVPTIMARLAAALAAGAAEGALAEGVAAESAMMGFAKAIGAEYSPESGITVPVSSSCISSIGYNNDRITVQFRRGGSMSYDYYGTAEEFISFVSSPSKGAWFNANLKNR